MTRFFLTPFIAIFGFSISTACLAVPTDELMQEVGKHLVKVQVGLANGGYGLGSGVVIAKDQVVTNCHVVANAASVDVNVQDQNYNVTAIKADWHHDLCILKVENLNVPAANIGSSEQLKYEQPVYTAGFAGLSPRPNGTSGYIKGLYPLDDSVVVRTSNAFRLGDSGGGLFDEHGNLVGIITVKSPGHDAFYYHMSVEWVKRLMSQPEQAVVSEAKLPFWAEQQDKWPYFMKVVQPLKTQDWQALISIAKEWAAKEPSNAEALFYCAVAEYSLKDTADAEAHFNQVISKNDHNSSALYYLGLIAEENGKHTEALNMVATLNGLNETTASELKVAMGLRADASE